MKFSLKTLLKISFIAYLHLVLAFTSFGQNTQYISTQKAKEDLDFLITNIEEVHYNPYFKYSKNEIYHTLNQIKTQFSPDSITYKSYIASGMKLTAMMSGGHTALDWQSAFVIPEIKSELYIPFSGQLDSNNQQFKVTHSAQPDIAVGTHVKSVNGVNMTSLFKECMTYIGGIEGFKKAYCEKIFPLYLFFTDQIKAPYQFELNTGETITHQGLNFSDLVSFLNQKIPAKKYTFEIIEGDIGLITYNKCENYNSFQRFLKKTFKEIQKKHIQKLIIDIRNNTGGNSSLNQLLLSYITQKPFRQASGRYWKVSEQAKAWYESHPVYQKLFGQEFMNEYMNAANQSIIKDAYSSLHQPTKPKNYYEGQTCFLIGPNTFSSANFLADAVKTYQLSTLIGSSTGELTNDFGEQLSIQLPHSGLTLYVSSTYDIGANGNPDVYEAVQPDIEVKQEVLKYAVKWMNQQQ